MPEEAAKFRSPEYSPVTPSAPSGASEAVQLPTPATRGAVHSGVVPAEKTTEPVGVPALEVTAAEYVTALPEVTELGETSTVVVVGAGESNTVTAPQQLPPTGSPTMAVSPGPERATDDPKAPAELGAVSHVADDQVPVSW